MTNALRGDARFTKEEVQQTPPLGKHCVPQNGRSMKMGKLEAPDTHFLSFAEGWMELEDCQSALDELELISKPCHEHFDVLQVRWHIYNCMQEWERCLSVSMRVLAGSTAGLD